MNKKNLPLIIATGLFLLSICYIIYLKQENFSQRESLLNLRVEVIEWQQRAEQEASRAERLAVDAIEAQTLAERAAKEAERQKDLAVIAQQQALKSK